VFACGAGEAVLFGNAGAPGLGLGAGAGAGAAAGAAAAGGSSKATQREFDAEKWKGWHREIAELVKEDKLTKAVANKLQPIMLKRSDDLLGRLMDTFTGEECLAAELESFVHNFLP
jgi:hypothetical protein